MKVGCISFFPNQYFSVMDMDKLTGFDRITSKNGLFPPVLPVSPALLFPLNNNEATSTITMMAASFKLISVVATSTLYDIYNESPFASSTVMNAEPSTVIESSSVITKTSTLYASDANKFSAVSIPTQLLIMMKSYNQSLYILTTVTDTVIDVEPYDYLYETSFFCIIAPGGVLHSILL